MGSRSEPMKDLTRTIGEVNLAASRVRYAFKNMDRTMKRSWQSPGADHIERIMREIVTGVPGRDPALRLLVACDFAEVLDRGR
jgi:hypothetical protein